MKKIKKQIYYQHQHLPIILVLGLIIGAVYMHINNSCVSLGREITGQEKEIIKIKNQLVIENQRWATLTSPRNLEQAIQRHWLNMSMPNNTQIIYVERWNRSEQTANIGAEKIF